MGENQTAVVSVGGVQLLRWESSPFVLNPDLSRSTTPNPFYRAGAVTGDADNPNTDASINERVVLTIPRSQIAGSSFSIDFLMDNALNDWWWAIDNIEVYAGLQAPSTEFGLKAVVNRDTGEITLVNNSQQPVGMRGYTVSSVEGSLVPAEYSPLSGSESGWIRFSVPTSKNDMSEGFATGVRNFTPGASVSLGDVWFKSPDESGDLSFQYLNDDGVVVNAAVEYVGNGGSAFHSVTSTFDGDVDIADWTEFKSGIPSTLTGLTNPELYRASDLNSDRVHDLPRHHPFPSGVRRLQWRRGLRPSDRGS